MMLQMGVSKSVLQGVLSDPSRKGCRALKEQQQEVDQTFPGTSKGIVPDLTVITIQW